MDFRRVAGRTGERKKVKIFGKILGEKAYIYVERGRERGR